MIKGTRLPVVQFTVRGVGSLIRELREAKSLQAKQLAAAAEIDPSVLSKIENNSLGLATDVLIRIAAALDIAPLDLAQRCLARVQFDMPLPVHAQPSKP